MASLGALIRTNFQLLLLLAMKQCYRPPMLILVLPRLYCSRGMAGIHFVFGPLSGHIGLAHLMTHTCFNWPSYIHKLIRVYEKPFNGIYTRPLMHIYLLPIGKISA